jgi:hypothetical protein
MPEPKKAKHRPQDYDHLAQVLEDIYLTGYTDRKKLLKMSFLKGLAGGLGGVIGATVVVALLLWVLARFHEVPLIGPFFDSAQDTIQSSE